MNKTSKGPKSYLGIQRSNCNKINPSNIHLFNFPKNNSIIALYYDVLFLNRWLRELAD